MYCDSCGAKLSYEAKYCRRCGRRLETDLNDTKPLPVITPTMLYNYRTEEPKRSVAYWYKSVLPRKPITHRSKVGRILYDLGWGTVLIALLYVLANFQTVKEYQQLTGLWGCLLLLKLWWKR